MEEKEFIEGFKKKVVGLMAMPVATIVFALLGEFIMAAICIIVFLIGLKQQHQIVAFILSDTWFRNRLLCWTASISILFAVRILILEKSAPYSSIIVFLVVATLILGFYVLFKSEKGKASITRFYQHYGN